MAKKLSLEEVIELIPSLTSVDFMKLKEEVDKEHKARLALNEHEGAVLKNGGK